MASGVVEPERDYELLDFGNGWKRERFGSVEVMRPAPAADGSRPWPKSRKEGIEFRLHDDREMEGKGAWRGLDRLPSDWTLAAAGLTLGLKPTPFGHLGVFPEQIVHWEWLGTDVGPTEDGRALNLFAYTGGTTLALARQGWQVTHVDAARNVVQWARENAVRSQLDAAPVRWIDEDALRFVERELRRGNRYEAVVADPPSFGRGPRRETWKMERDFERLCEGLAELSGRRPRLVLITCHTPGFTPSRLVEILSQKFGIARSLWEAFPLSLMTADARQLSAGVSARYIG